MKAVQLIAWESMAEIRDVPVPEPGPGQVLIKVAGAGVCHSDLHLMEWPGGMLAYPLPFTLGHETAGWVHTLGAGVTGLEVDEPVMVYGPWGCGRCHACARGAENYCERAAEIPAAGGGLGRDGGMAEYMLVPHERLLVPLGDLDPATAAPLADAALTPYHAIKRSLPRLTPGRTALVIGVGGLGHTVRFGALAWEAAVSMPYWGTRPELIEVIELARAGRIRPHVETFPLADAPHVYAELKAGHIQGRAVLLPGG